MPKQRSANGDRVSKKLVVVERKILVAASAETIFGFLVDGALMAQWFGLSHTLEPSPGGVFRVECPPGNVALGRYTEVVPHRRVAFTWGWEPGHEGQLPELKALLPGASLVEIDLERTEGGTLVRLRHSKLPEDLSEMHGDRWAYYLTRLEIAAQGLESKQKQSASTETQPGK
jgi:uncharacterized protein YndB with AHSA1/START domain